MSLVTPPNSNGWTIPLRSPGIDSKASIPRAYVSWWVVSTNMVVVPARLDSIPGLLKMFTNTGSVLTKSETGFYMTIPAL